MGRLCFQSGSEASPLSFPQGTETIFFVCGGEWVAFFFSPSNPESARQGLGLCREQLWKTRENAGGARERTVRGGTSGCLHRASPGPTCEEAGPCGAGPISTYLRSPGPPHPHPGSREPRFSKGRAELSGALTRSRGSFSPHSLQPWGSLVGLSRPSSSASSSYSRYSIALPDPCRDVPQRAGGVRTRRWRRGESRTGLPGAKVVRESL